MDDLPHFELSGQENLAETSPSKQALNALLRSACNVSEDSSRILAFKHKAPAPPEDHVNQMAGLYNSNLGQCAPRKQYRHIPITQDRILDAPDLVDDYYLNLLDWSSNNTVSARCCATLYPAQLLCCCSSTAAALMRVCWSVSTGCWSSLKHPDHLAPSIWSSSLQACDLSLLPAHSTTAVAAAAACAPSCRLL
jgi:hypothetical protein